MSNGAKVVINEQMEKAAEKLIPLSRKFRKEVEKGRVPAKIANAATLVDLDALPGLFKAVQFYEEWEASQ